MNLYHFTAKHLYEKIKDQGIKAGAILVRFNPVIIKPGYIWLTKNPEFQQSWCEERILINYDRAAVRIQVRLNDFEKEKLLTKWIPGGENLTPLFSDLNRFGDPENWFVFEGKISPKRFISVEHKLTQTS